MRRGDSVELEIEKFADRGKSLARCDGYVVFVPGAVPGDRVRARIRTAKKKFAEASLEEVLSPSPLRTQPRCFYFGTCGGCKWQHVAYEAQLAAKFDSVRDALVHTGGFENVEMRPAIGSEKIYYYRNKMEFSFSAGRWLTSEEIQSGKEFDTSFALGLHVPGNFEKVLDIQACHLQSELSVRIVNSMRDLARSHSWEPWNTRKHLGFLRHLVIRTGERTDEVMVNLVTNGFDSDRIAQVSQHLQGEFPEVTTFVNTINTTPAQTAFGEEIHTIYGPGVIHDRIGPYTFEIAANAFFQTNTAQAERLYDVTREFADLRPNDVVYDLYCGAGTIAIYLAEDVARVVGVELVQEAVDNAKANAGANGVGNCTFVAGDMLALYSKDFMREHGEPDVLVVDPPRAGMHPKIVQRIAEIGPERFVYVSCNPQTQARDLKVLADVYRIEAVQPVDMFPHTHHVESVVKLRRKAGR
ncbi:MAG: 23S rRNA (uracil(1939)-C(5))-methyltransferase RlmD [Rhodothermales bacterium]